MARMISALLRSDIAILPLFYRLVAQDHDAGRQRLRVEEFQLKALARLEQRGAAAEDDRIYRNAKLVDQSTRYQTSGKIGAAEQKNVFCALVLQSCHRTRHVRAEHLRIVP